MTLGEHYALIVICVPLVNCISSREARSPELVKLNLGVPRIIHEKSVDELRRMGENAGNGLDNLDRRYKLAVCW